MPGAKGKTGARQRSRSWSLQDDNGLTELAAPAPVSSQEHGDDLSREQSRAIEEQRSEEEGNEAGLTELAAPTPVAEGEEGAALEEAEEEEREEQNGDAGDDFDTSTFDGGSERADEQQQSVCSEEPSQGEKPAELAQTHAPIVVWNEVVTISWLIFFSFLGTLARLGVEAVNTYPSTPFISTVLWANLSGSLFLGFLLEDRRLFHKTVPVHLITDDTEATHAHIARHQKTVPLYIGLATGFCGSFTSFSTFITDAFLALSNNLASSSPGSPNHEISLREIPARNGGYSFLAVVGVLIVEPAVSISALKTGAHIALATESIMPGIPTKLFGWLDRIAVVLGFGCWTGAILLSIFPPGPASAWRSRATLPLVFSPPGVLMRFYLSKTLNPRLPSFPLGTFASNIIGTVVEAVCFVLQHTGSIVYDSGSVDTVTCTVLQGLMQGFCGCLTTVSTWVAELNGLRRRHGWVYGLVSLAVALSLQIAVMGSVLWTRGFVESCVAVG